VSQISSKALPAPADARAPRTVEDTGLPFLFLAELISKVLFQRGQLRLAELASHLKLNVSVIDPLVAFLRAEKLCEIARVGNSREAFYTGPQVTHPAPREPGFYRDPTGALKREAAEFRIYGYNAAGEVVRSDTRSCPIAASKSSSESKA